jgi:superfamily II DNA/RNA helicase
MGRLKGHTFKSIVVDEADRLLGDENLESVRKIILAAPRDRQLVFASATVQPRSEGEIMSLSPDLVMLHTAVTPVNENIEHLYFVCEERDKPELLRKAIHAFDPDRAIVFVHLTETAEFVADKLAYHHVPVADLHGAREKNDRKQAMDDFRSGRVQVLMASDVAARGLDIAGVTHIFNLDAPSQSKAYLHRVGRTARAGAKGIAVSILTENETRLIRRYGKELGITLTEVRLREGRVIPADTPFEGE